MSHREWRHKTVIRISQIHEGSKQRLLVEGTLSGDWVDVLENCWLETPHTPNGEPMRIDLSGVTYIDDRGRELLARMIHDGAELRAIGVMTRAVIEEITEKIAMARNGQIPDSA
jgi:anti-anti-sigma regulatory factor